MVGTNTPIPDSAAGSDKSLRGIPSEAGIEAPEFPASVTILLPQG